MKRWHFEVWHDKLPPGTWPRINLIMGLRQNILNERVSELPLRELIGIQAETTVREATAVLQAKKLGCSVVVDENGRPLGKFTERCLIQVLTENPNGLDGPVKPYLIESPARVTMTDPISEVIEQLQASDERFVIVTDDQGKPVGITGHRGVMEYIAEHFPRQVKVQLMESKLYMNEREGA